MFFIQAETSSFYIWSICIGNSVLDLTFTTSHLLLAFQYRKIASDIPRMLEQSTICDIAVGSRWAQKDSLPGWNLFRRAMTLLGHILTKVVLGISQDASGAFRAYRLDRLPKGVFDLVKSKGYSFFFESLFISSFRFLISSLITDWFS